MAGRSLGWFLAGVVEFYSLALIIWVVSSWIPNARHAAPLRLLGRLCEPALRPLRQIIPPIGGLDLSPIAAIVLLQLLAGFLRGLPL